MRFWWLPILAAVALPSISYAAETAVIQDRVYAFVVGDAQINIMDVTVPRTPLPVSAIPYDGHPVQSFPADGGTYLAVQNTSDGSLHIIDVTNPYRPTRISTLSASGEGPNYNTIRDMAVARTPDGTILLMVWDDSVGAVDVTNPWEPYHMYVIRDGDYGFYALDDASMVEAFEAGGRAYALVSGTDSIQIMDVLNGRSSPGTEIRQGQYGFGYVGSIIDVGAFRYGSATYGIVAGDDSIIIINLTDPSRPAQVSSVAIPPDGITITGMDVLETDGGAYALLMDVGVVHVADVSDPANPVIVSSTPAESYLCDLYGACAGIIPLVGRDDGAGVLGVVQIILQTTLQALTDENVIPLDDIFGVQAGGRTWALLTGPHGITSLDITDPAAPFPGYVSSGSPPRAPVAVETATIGDRLYALTASNAADTIQILDITEPGQIRVASQVTGGQFGYGQMYGPHDIAVAQMDGGTYAVVPNVNSNTVTILDVTVPKAPRVSSVLESDTLFAPVRAVAFPVDESWYVAVASNFANGVQILDITDPRSPLPGAFIRNDQYGFAGLEGSLGLEAATVGGSPYLIVAGYYDGAVQIIDVADPTHPVPAGIMFDGRDGYRISGPHDIAVAYMGERSYAAVASVHDDSVTIIDITDPYFPEMVSRIADGINGVTHLKSPQHIEHMERDGRSYILITSYFDMSMLAFDITDPGNPVLVADIIYGQGEIDPLSGPLDISVAYRDGGAYAVVAGYFENGIQVMDVSDPALPTTLASVSGGPESSFSLFSSHGIGHIAVDGSTFAISSVFSQDMVRVTDITDPYNPVPVAVLKDGDGYALAGPSAIRAGTISGKPYAVITGMWKDTMQVVDMSDPRAPQPASTIRNGQGGFDDFVSMSDLDLAYVGDETYGVSVSTAANLLYVTNLTTPSKPAPVAVARDGQDGFDLFNPEGVRVISRNDGTFALVANFLAGSVQIVDMSDPRNLIPASSISGKTPTYDMVSFLTDVDWVQTQDKTVMVLSSYRTDAVTLVDITDPYSPRFIRTIQGGDPGYYIHGLEGVHTATINGRAYVSVASSNDSIQLIDITDPYNPAPAGLAGDGLDSTIYGATDLDIVQMDSGAYILALTLNEDVSPIILVGDGFIRQISTIPPVAATYAP